MESQDKIFEFEEKDQDNFIVKFNKVNDMRNGDAILYYSDGAKWIEFKYENNKRNGNAIEYYSDGTYCNFKYENNMMNGDAILYYPDGTYCNFKYENNMKNGDAILYYPDGHKSTEFKYENNMRNGDAIQYHSDGEYSKFKYENDMLQGNAIQYYSNDIIHYIFKYENNMRNGDAIEYYQDGEKGIEFKYENDMRNGDAIEYYPDGRYKKLKFENNNVLDYSIHFNKSDKITRIVNINNDTEIIVFLNKLSYIHLLSLDNIIELINNYSDNKELINDLLNKKNTDKISKLEKTNKELINDLLNNSKKNIDKISKLEKTNKDLRNELLKNNSLEEDKCNYKKILDEQYKDENCQIKNENWQLNNKNYELNDEIRKYKTMNIEKDNKIKEYIKYKNEYDKLNKSKKKLESENGNLKNQIKDYKKEIKDLKRQIEVLTESKKSVSDWEKKYNESNDKETKTREILKTLKEGLNFESKDNSSVIIEYYKKLSKDIQDLSNQQLTNLKKLPEKSKKYRWTINGKPFNEKHPKWEKHSHILNEFNTVLHNKNKMESLIKRLGWKLKNNNNHKVYEKLNYRFISPSTPAEWATTYFNLEKIEKEIIENDN